MNSFKNKYLMALLLVTTVLSACKKQWDDRTETVDQQLDKTVMQQIQEDGNLSTFSGYLTKLGYDKLLAGSKSYTIFAPTNQALQTMDQAVVADTARLKSFVNNHITNLVYLTTAPKPTLRIRTLGGKNITLASNTIEDATITTANKYVKNGVIHIINKALPPKMNISEFIRSLNGVADLQKAYIVRNDTSYVDTTKATVTGYNPQTGKPILAPGTGVVRINRYFDRVASLANEDSTYTYFVLTDAAYDAERNKVSKYFATVTNSVDTTLNILAGFNVLKDAAVRGSYAQANLANLVSVNNVPVPVSQGAIVQSYSASNGMVYVVNSLPFSVASKITPIVIEGERPSFFARTDAGGSIFYRSRNNQGVTFRDIMIGTTTSLPASFFAAYKLNNLYTCQYKIVVKAQNDITFSTPTDIVQSFNFGQITAPTTVSGTITPNDVVRFPAQRMGPASLVNFEEVQLPTPANKSATSIIAVPTNIAGGNPTTTATAANTINLVSGNLTVLKRSSINMYVVGNSTTALNTNNITFDYVKLIPIIQ